MSAYSATAQAEVKALACALPAETGVPLARWSRAELAAEAVTCGLVPTVSASTVGRWLAADAIRPWRYRSWIFPRDPDFAVKAARVLDLYDRTWDGQPLGDDYVLCADEKTQMQALSRGPPTSRRRPNASGGRSSSITAAARCPIWPPTTCTPPGCSAAARPPPASHLSPRWSRRS